MAGVSSAIITQIVFALFAEIGKHEPASTVSFGDIAALLVGMVIFSLCVIHIYNWWTDK